VVNPPVWQFAIKLPFVYNNDGNIIYITVFMLKILNFTIINEPIKSFILRFLWVVHFSAMNKSFGHLSHKVHSREAKKRLRRIIRRRMEE